MSNVNTQHSNQYELTDLKYFARSQSGDITQISTPKNAPTPALDILSKKFRVEPYRGADFYVATIRDRPPKNRTFQKVSFATKSALWGGRFCREEEAFFGRAHSGDFEGGRPWDPGVGVVPAARYFGAKRLPVEEAVRQHGAF